MNSDNRKDKQDKKKDIPPKGGNFKAGREENGSLPNSPAENAERTSPEEDRKKHKEKK